MGEQLDQHAVAARGRWFGAKAAANYLGLHRSTLFLAVQRKHLIPDQFTPGGHARFREATLEAFRNQIANEAATSETPLYAPLHTLADLAHAVNNVAPPTIPAKLFRDREISEEVHRVCESAVKAITTAPLQIPKCLVALRVVDPHDPFAMHIVEQKGITPQFLHHYALLRQQPNAWFATMDALQKRTPIICEDTTTISLLHNGSAQLIQEHHIGSYAIVPIVGGNASLGILLLISDTPRTYTDHEEKFLCGVADQIATAVTNQSRADHVSTYAKAGRDLTQLALTVRAQAAASVAASAEAATAPGAITHALRQLCDIFLAGADAAGVCTVGFTDAALPSPCAELNALTEQALYRAPSRQREPQASDGDANDAKAITVDAAGYITRSWMSQGAPISALAISVPLDGQRRAAVGAMWRRAAWSDEEHLLLVTLAGACAMASGA